MSKGGMKNGHDHGPSRGHGQRGAEDRKVASLADARKRRQQEEKAAKAAAAKASRAGRGPLAAPDPGRGSVKGWVFAVIVVAMALGMLAWWLVPVLRAAGVKF